MIMGLNFGTNTVIMMITVYMHCFEQARHSAAMYKPRWRMSPMIMAAFRDHGRVPGSVWTVSDNHREAVIYRWAPRQGHGKKGAEIASLQAVVGSSVVVKKKR